MTPRTAPAPFSPRRKRALFALYLGLLLVLLAGGGEIVARLKGVRPYQLAPINIAKVEPGGKFYTPHPDRGYTQLPGQFKITLTDGYTFTVTHDTNGLRITHPPSAPVTPPKQGIWILGCSLTHGWSLNDAETYPWLVQQALPGREVVNAGMMGYGTLQSRLLFQDLLKSRPPPAVVVLAYGTFHDFRNTFIRLRRKAVAPYNRLGPLVQPYARLSSAGDLDYFMAPVEYVEFPFMRHSALSHLLEMEYDNHEARASHSDVVSRMLVSNLATFCEKNGIKFVLAGISSDSGPMLAFCQGRGIAAVDISVVLAEPGNRNLPHDDHPSPAANRVYAQKLAEYLTSQVLTPPQPARPPDNTIKQ